MKATFAALVLLVGIVGVALSAHAYNCQTTCYGVGQYRTCSTNCW